MNDVLNIQTILGYVANDNPLRASRDGKEFEGVLPVPVWSEEIVKRGGSVTDTVSEMKRLIRHYNYQVANLAPRLKGRTIYDTCKNIWNFLYTHIKYKEDEEGKEQLRTPSRSFAERLRRGIDCDDFSIFCGCLLYRLNIPFYIRIARYKGKDYFQHVYPVVPLKNKRYITIDAVLDEYDTEKQPVETKDFLVMNTSNLNGIDISVLGLVESDEFNELSGILYGDDFKELEQMEGLGRIPTHEQQMQAIRRHLERTRGIIYRRPHLIKDVEHPQSFLGMVDYALKYWDTDKRDEALGILAAEEDRINEMEGLSSKPEGYEDVELFYGMNGLGSYDVLGRVKRQRKFFSKIKDGAKKGGIFKKVVRALTRFNPLTASIRAAVLIALKVNLLKVSSKFKWGYLTEEEAQSKGFNMEQWRKLKKQLQTAENMYVKLLGGKAENFKKAMLSGRGGKLSGPDSLGYVVAAASAGAASTAIPFITKIMNLLKKIDYKKLIANVSGMIAKGKKAKAEESNEPTEEGGSALPEGGQTSEGDPNVDVSQDAPQDQEETTKGSSDETGSGSEASDNLPAKTKKSADQTDSGGSGEEGFMNKAFTWVKENPSTSILIAGGAAFLLYQAFSKPSSKHGLSGARRGKKKKGKAKNHPPKTVSGTKRPAKKRKPHKKFKL